MEFYTSIDAENAKKLIKSKIRGFLEEWEKVNDKSELVESIKILCENINDEETDRFIRVLECIVDFYNKEKENAHIGILRNALDDFLLIEDEDYLYFISAFLDKLEKPYYKVGLIGELVVLKGILSIIISRDDMCLRFANSEEDVKGADIILKKGEELLKIDTKIKKGEDDNRVELIYNSETKILTFKMSYNDINSFIDFVKFTPTMFLLSACRLVVDIYNQKLSGTDDLVDVLDSWKECLSDSPKVDAKIISENYGFSIEIILK